MKKIIFFVFIICGINNLFAQNYDTKPLLDSVKNKMNKVNDYSADVSIKLNVSFIKIPVKKATIYFKKPDKIRMKTTGFAMLPKKGANFNAGDFLKKDFASIFIKQEIVKGIKTEMIKVVPLTADNEILLATMWIDRKTQLIYKIDATTKANGNFLMEFSYPKIANAFDMPAALQFTFDVNKTTLPVAISGDLDSDSKKVKDDGKPKKATLTLNYSNYKVNTGIPDSFFVDEKRKK
jgi:hypothetical protein